MRRHDHEMTDSSHLVGDGPALRARLGAYGYVFLRQLLPSDVVRAVGSAGLRSLQRAGWTASGVDPIVAPPLLPIRAVRMRDAFADPGYRRILADPAFNALAFSPELTDLMGHILGPMGFCYPLKIPRVVYPANLVPLQPGNFVHKDYGAVQDMFTCWVPLGDVPRTLGGLAVSPGSHRAASVPPRPFHRLERGWLTTDYVAGDVLVFHCMTTHAALPNREGRLRFSAEYRWQLADQPAPRRMVIGPNGREIGSRMFARADWWHSVSRGLTLMDGGGIEDGPVLPAAPSRFVAAPARRL
jgi:hypothetical protein